MENIVKFTEKQYLRDDANIPWISGSMYASTTGGRVPYSYYSDGQTLRIHFSFGGYEYYKDYDGSFTEKFDIYIKAQNLIESLINTP